MHTDPVVYTNAAFGQASLPILLDDVQCSGSEATLTSCVYDSNTADCIHAEDAGVKCQHGKLEVKYTVNHANKHTKK